MKTVLFVVHEAGEFVELRRVAQSLRARAYEVSFLFAQPGYVNLRQDRAWCRFNGCAAYYPGKRVGLSTQERENRALSADLENGYRPFSLAHNRPGGSFAGKAMALAALPFLALGEQLWSKRRLARSRKLRKQQPRSFPGSSFRYARKVMDCLAPDLLVFGQDFPGSTNAMLTRVARQRGIPALIIPFALGTTREMCESLADNPLHDVAFSWLNRLAATLYPHWVNYFGTKALLRLPGRDIIILEALGLAPTHPWLPNNSRANLILAESAAMERYYRSMGFPAEQLRVTGSPYDDILAAARRTASAGKERICSRLGIDPGKPILLCAWPTDQYGSRFVPLEFPDYKRLCQAWAGTLARIQRMTPYNIVIRPHPVTSQELLEEVLRPFRLHKRVTNIDTLELVPVSDLFVACVSSTLRWAIACGIPAVNYDCYDYGYTDFDSAEGVFTVKQYADFEDVVERLAGDSAAYDSARSAQEKCAPDWGMQDGQSMARIDRMIAELTAKP